MSYSAEQNRFNRALDAAERQWPPGFFHATRIKDKNFPFHLQMDRDDDAARIPEIYLIRITLNKITDDDIVECWDYEINRNIFTKILACKFYGVRGFEYIIGIEKGLERALDKARKIMTRHESVKPRMARGMVDKEPGFVYFARSMGHGVVKIGKARDVHNRIATLGAANPGIRYIGCIASPEPYDLEYDLHQRFKKYHIQGEWFKYSEELKNFIDQKARKKW